MCFIKTRRSARSKSTQRDRSIFFFLMPSQSRTGKRAAKRCPSPAAPRTRPSSTAPSAPPTGSAPLPPPPRAPPVPRLRPTTAQRTGSHSRALPRPSLQEADCTKLSPSVHTGALLTNGGKKKLLLATIQTVFHLFLIDFFYVWSILYLIVF